MSYLETIGGVFIVEKIETLFSWLDHTAEMIEASQNEPYLDCLAHAMEILFYREVSNIDDDLTAKKIEKSLQTIDLKEFQQIEIRKAVQMAILKGMKENTQQQHLITPEAVALFIGYLANKFMSRQDTVTLFDPACGTSNLLTTVIGQLHKSVEAYGSDVDPTLMRLSLANANLQEMEIEFFQQDSLRPFLMAPVDLVVSDLPVGYYPDDVNASQYKLKAEEGHSYAHHLFIEQSLTYTKEAGYLIILVPNFLFTSDQAEQLQTFLKEHAHIYGLLQLPESIFKSKANAKSILVLQKKGPGTATPKQPLLVQLPSFKNEKAMADIIGQMNTWFSKYL